MKKLLGVLLMVLFILGCASVPLEITSIGKTEYEVVGEGSGSAVGIMLFELIPIGQNTRFQRAYNAAVNSRGGDALLNPVISENWFWAYVLNGYVTKIKGTVIKYKK